METGYSNSRLHPAIDRDERDGLWSGLPGIYVATLNLIGTIADRLQESFLSLAPTLHEQLAWIFPSGKHDPAFRLVTYQVLSKVLLRGGHGLIRKQSLKLSIIIRSCCNDLLPSPEPSNTGTPKDVVNVNGKRPLNQNHKEDNVLRQPSGLSHGIDIEGTDLFIAASNLLPLFMSHVSQQYLDVPMRSLIERAAILTHNKNAMLASILYPFVGKDRRAITSILPHLTREFQGDQAVELLLRPRLPMVPSGSTGLPYEEGVPESIEDEDMEMHHETSEAYSESVLHNAQPVASIAAHHGLGNSIMSNSDAGVGLDSSFPATFSAPGSFPTAVPTPGAVLAEPSPTLLDQEPPSQPYESRRIVGTAVGLDAPQATDELSGDSGNSDGTDSDDESVHLTMELDTDSSDTDG
jgi:hypothetical protein